MIRWIKKIVLATVVTAAAAALPAAPAAATNGQSELAGVRAATDSYHDVTAAEHAGFGRALSCFDLPGVGGMGQHYINGGNIGGTDPLKPAAMVYQLNSDGSLHLGAVEWIVPRTADNMDNPPVLFGTQFTAVTVNNMPLWVLHAWIWKPNPAGMFENYNPSVPLCPPGT